MRAHTIQLHNFRSIKDITVALDDYSLLVGENNTGKTTLLSAIRAFYEEGGAKFSRDTDFPKFPTADSERFGRHADRFHNPAAPPIDCRCLPTGCSRAIV